MSFNAMNPICSNDAPCWMPGTGFRWIKDTGSTCAIDDDPLDKFVPVSFAGKDPMDILRFWFGGSDADPVHVPGTDVPHIAAVPLDGSGAYMAGGILLITALIAAWHWRAALGDAGAYVGGSLIAALMIAASWKIMPWLEAQKGDSGWAADTGE